MTKTRNLADLGGGFIQEGTGAVQRGAIIRNYKPAGNKYGIKYTELLAFIISAL